MNNNKVELFRLAIMFIYQCNYVAKDSWGCFYHLFRNSGEYIFILRKQKYFLELCASSQRVYVIIEIIQIIQFFWSRILDRRKTH